MYIERQAWVGLIWRLWHKETQLPEMRLLTERDQYDVTDSSPVSARFYSLVFSFYFTDDASVRYNIPK
jgi:hypothetical protein